MPGPSVFEILLTAKDNLKKRNPPDYEPDPKAILAEVKRLGGTVLATKNDKGKYIDPLKEQKSNKASKDNKGKVLGLAVGEKGDSASKGAKNQEGSKTMAGKDLGKKVQQAKLPSKTKPMDLVKKVQQGATPKEGAKPPIKPKPMDLAKKVQQGATPKEDAKPLNRTKLTPTEQLFHVSNSRPQDAVRLALSMMKLANDEVEVYKTEEKVGFLGMRTNYAKKRDEMSKKTLEEFGIPFEADNGEEGASGGISSSSAFDPPSMMSPTMVKQALELNPQGDPIMAILITEALHRIFLLGAFGEDAPVGPDGRADSDYVTDNLGRKAMKDVIGFRRRYVPNADQETAEDEFKDFLVYMIRRMEPGGNCKEVTLLANAFIGAIANDEAQEHADKASTAANGEKDDGKYFEEISKIARKQVEDYKRWEQLHKSGMEINNVFLAQQNKAAPGEDVDMLPVLQKVHELDRLGKMEGYTKLAAELKKKCAQQQAAKKGDGGSTGNKGKKGGAAKGRGGS